MNRYLYIIVLICSVVTLNTQVSFSQTQFRETVWLQINRDIYLAGEDVNFKANLLENDTYSPSVLSRNIRIELIDDKGNKISRQNLELRNSRISGKITLPLELSTGWYYIRSYSNWMRNFPEEYFTDLPIRVLNPIEMTPDSIYYQNDKLNLRIFPSNGAASYDEKRCSVFASDKYNQGIAASGHILNVQGDTVLLFNTDRTGWASSFFRPTSENIYQIYAEGYKTEDIEHKIELNSIIDNNVKVTMKEVDGYIIIDLENSSGFTPYKVLIHRAYSWSWFHSATAIDGQLKFSVPIKDLPSGISQVIVLDIENNLIFKQLWSDYKLVNSEINIEIDTSDIRIDNEYGFNYHSSGYFVDGESHSLFQITQRYLDETRMFDYLPGLPGWPARTEIPAEQIAFNAWLAANTYPDETSLAFFRKNPELPNNPDFSNSDMHGIQYYAETRGGIISGQITNRNSGLGISNQDIALTDLNSNKLYAASTDQQGNFVLSFPDHNGSMDYILNYIDFHDQSFKMEIFPDFAPVNSIIGKNEASFKSSELEFLMEQSLKLQLKEIYYNETEVEKPLLEDSNSVRETFFGKPEVNIKVDDYIKLPNIREVIFELVPFLNIRKKNNKYELFVTGEYINESSYPTLILFDGVPIYEYDQLLDLPPERISTIEVKTEFYIHGNVIFEGIVNIRSKNNDFGGLKIPPASILSTVQLPQVYTDHSIKANQRNAGWQPSIDNILVWEQVNTGTNVKGVFYLNDNPGRYMLSIYGFDKNGKWHSGKKIFDALESKSER